MTEIKVSVSIASGGKYLNTTGHIVPVRKTDQWLSECKFMLA